MRAIDRRCGHGVEAADDDDLFRLCSEHVGSEHSGMQRSDEQIRACVTADANDVAPVA